MEKRSHRDDKHFTEPNIEASSVLLEEEILNILRQEIR